MLTPTTAPSTEELRQIRDAEAAAGVAAPDGTEVVPCRYAGADPRHQLYATDNELATLPKLLVQFGTRESLLDDSRRFVARATSAGTRVTNVEHPDVVHMWMVMAPDLPESCRAFDLAAQFLSDPI